MGLMPKETVPFGLGDARPGKKAQGKGHKRCEDARAAKDYFVTAVFLLPSLLMARR